MNFGESLLSICNEILQRLDIRFSVAVSVLHPNSSRTWPGYNPLRLVKPPGTQEMFPTFLVLQTGARRGVKIMTRPLRGLFLSNGGEGGIRTLGTGVSPYNGLANRRIRPLCHLSGVVRSYSLPRSL